MSTRRLILASFQSPGDIEMLTATVRDLHIAHPGKFNTDVSTSCDALWLNNPYITRLTEGQPGVEYIQMHYPLIHESNQRPYHFIHGYTQFLEQQLGVILKHIQKCRPNWIVDVAALVGKHTAFHGLCRTIYVLEREFPPCCEYQQRFNLE